MKNKIIKCAIFGGGNLKNRLTATRGKIGPKDKGVSSGDKNR
tara:strand:- start:319 stop:444 length:126 start_codon:yes stop_codon:yes gene_type:complete